jgi:hypothetical protein
MIIEQKRGRREERKKREGNKKRKGLIVSE